MWSAVILAGGRARRLGGRDKAALDIGRSTILERQLALLRPLVDRILIVVSDASHTHNAARFATADVPVVTDLKPGTGPLGGIYTAIQEAATPRVLVTACDLPFLTAPFLARLMTDGRDVDVVLPRAGGGYHPLAATYSQRAGEAFGAQLDQGVRKITDAIFAADDLVVRELGPDELAPYDPNGTLLFNVNTPDDYARAIDLGASFNGEH